MYAYQGLHFSTSLLTTFRLRDRAGTVTESGSVSRTNEALLLEMKVSGFSSGCTIRVICGGVVTAETDTRELSLHLPVAQGRGYACRAEIRGPDGETIATNPVYVVPEDC
jgi:hypothetical protein